MQIHKSTQQYTVPYIQRALRDTIFADCAVNSHNVANNGTNWNPGVTGIDPGDPVT